VGNLVSQIRILFMRETRFPELSLQPPVTQQLSNDGLTASAQWKNAREIAGV